MVPRRSKLAVFLAGLFGLFAMAGMSGGVNDFRMIGAPDEAAQWAFQLVQSALAAIVCVGPWTGWTGTRTALVLWTVAAGGTAWLGATAWGGAEWPVGLASGLSAAIVGVVLTWLGLRAVRREPVVRPAASPTGPRAA